jgi:hypothetical protein
VRTRRGRQPEAADHELESWVHALVEGEASARRYRQRLRAEGTTPDDAYVVVWNTGRDSA